MSGDGFRVSRIFRDLIPPLAKEERAELEASILRDGCRDPLVVWKEEGTLLDGHTRAEICHRHEKPYKLRHLSFPDREAAKEWVIRNQFGRRNLSPVQRAELGLELDVLLAAKAKENQREHGGTAPGRNTLRESRKVIHRDREIAAVTGVSSNTIHKARVVLAKADDETKAKLRRGEGKSLNAVYTEIRRKEKLDAIQERAAAESSGDTEEVIQDLSTLAGKIRCVYYDLPLAYDDETARGAVAGHYPTQPVEALIDEYATAMKALAHPDGCHFWGWFSGPKNRDGVPHRFLEACGLRWVGEVYWDKVHQGTGRWLCSQVEILVLAVPKDKPNLPLLRRGVPNYYREVRTATNSAKPLGMYDLIESLSPGPRLEMFARVARKGWLRHGYEA